MRTFFTAMALLGLCSVAVADPDPAAMTIKLESQLVWSESPLLPGIKVAVVSGVSSGPGPYVVRVRFAPGVFSSPHFHPEERNIVILKGTWWVGSGPRFDKGAMTPLPVGTSVIHHANQVHFDGAKDEEVVLQISGVGPSATRPVDESGKPK